MEREYHVAITGCDNAVGSREHPFRTISRAAVIAMPGDKVIVHKGEYREWIRPKHGGTSEICRIEYMAAEGEHVVIKGSERIQCWEQIEGTVWKAAISNDIFGDYNPYKEILEGDWFLYPEDYSLHTGDVFLNGKSLYEAKSLEEVKNPVKRVEAYSWQGWKEKLADPEASVFQWFALTDEFYTTIYANFQGIDPNREMTEISVRKCCFYPEKTGRNYITVRGFEMAQAACPWAPPTAEQPGLLGVNWGKGWIIENNIIHDAKCSGISIGKEESTGHNLCTRTHRKPGYQYQMEAVFRARRIGWSKGTIGSHVIRNNEIYNCGQNGIVGHLGCVFSRIYGNHIHHIAQKYEFFGYEIAGIKLHAAIDVEIRNNNIHDCTLGAWLDWQAQGARVSKNLFYANKRDLMVEVSHGPYLVDNNIFGSKYNFENIAQGGAFVHNLCCGLMKRECVLERSTPYHFPHSTEVAGCAVVYGGDDRLYQNIFVGGQKTENTAFTDIALCYKGFTVSLEEYVSEVISLGNGDLELYQQVLQPVYAMGNSYLNGAPAIEREEDSHCSSFDPQVRIIEEDEEVYLEIQLENGMLETRANVLETKDLGMVRIAEAPFEYPDGTPIVFDTDYHGKKRGKTPTLGPLENLRAGVNRIKIWECKAK